MKGAVLMRVQINHSVWNVTLRVVKQEKLHAGGVLGVDREVNARFLHRRT